MGRKRRNKRGGTKQPARSRPGRVDAPGAETPAEQRNSRGWRIAFLVLCTVGVCLSADLLRLHVNVHTDPDYHSYCAMSVRVNCDTVAASEYSVFLGLPLALWGLIGYTALGALTVWGLRRHSRGPTWPLGLCFWLALGYSALGVALYLVSHVVVQSVCVVCAGTYAVNFALALVAYAALRRSRSGPLAGLRDDLRAAAAAWRSVLLFAAALLLVVLVTASAIPRYWRIEASTGPGGLSVGQTADGHPWIGAAEPLVEIVEFSDYQCPHCRRGHDEVRKLILQYPDQVRLIHRHFPLDHHCNPAIKRAYHPYACHYAKLSFCAQQQDKFWLANDYLFSQGRRSLQVTVEELAKDVDLDLDALRGCMRDDRGGRAIQRDLQAGRALHIRGTPTFVIDGEIYPGRVPPAVVSRGLGLQQSGSTQIDSEPPQTP